jgi:hypothetical protein
MSWNLLNWREEEDHRNTNSGKKVTRLARWTEGDITVGWTCVLEHLKEECPSLLLAH